MNRHHFQKIDANNTRHSDITYGDYFTAARRFFDKERFQLVSAVFSPHQTDRITDIHICLMKHGEFYHPARIHMFSDGRGRSFVLNVAVSESGRRVIDAEISALKRLGELTGPSFVPRVYGEGSAPIGSKLTADMFLGEWFEGYHEFHLSHSQPGDSQSICVWGESDEPCCLTSEESYLLYHQAARILTSYFNMATTEHISHWHHAAGDFVVKRDSKGLSVKLITARQYSPLIKMDKGTHDPSQKQDQAMAALLLFFLSLSIRMRLDRLDGIGDVAWADDISVIGVWTGFLEGLAGNCFPLLPDPVKKFEKYLSTYSTAGLYVLAGTLVAALPVSPAEKMVVETYIGHHMKVLCDTIGRIGFP